MYIADVDVVIENMHLIILQGLLNDQILKIAFESKQDLNNVNCT